MLQKVHEARLSDVSTSIDPPPYLVDMHVFLPMEVNGVFPQSISIVPRLEMNYADTQLGRYDNLIQAMACGIRRYVDMLIRRCVRNKMVKRLHSIFPSCTKNLYTHTLITTRVCKLPKPHLSILQSIIDIGVGISLESSWCDLCCNDDKADIDVELVEQRYMLNLHILYLNKAC